MTRKLPLMIAGMDFIRVPDRDAMAKVRASARQVFHQLLLAEHLYRNRVHSFIVAQNRAWFSHGMHEPQAWTERARPP